METGWEGEALHDIVMAGMEMEMEMEMIGLGSAQGGRLRWRTLGVGGTNTQVENPFHRLHQTKAAITGHVMNNCFCLGFVLFLE